MFECKCKREYFSRSTHAAEELTFDLKPHMSCGSEKNYSIKASKGMVDRESCL